MGYIKSQYRDTGTYRASYNLWMDLKFKNYRRFKQNLLILLFLKKDKWHDREIIFTDSILIPFNIKFGCKLSGHNWKALPEFGKPNVFCSKCYGIQSLEKFKSINREEKIDSILKN